MRRYRDLPLRIKGLVVVSIPLLTFLLVIAAFYLAQERSNEAELWVRQSLRARGVLLNIRAMWSGAEAAVLGYLATGDPDWLTAFRRARERVPELFQEHDLLMRSIPGAEESAAALQKRIMARLDELEAIRERAAAEPESATALIAKDYADEEGILNALSDLLEQENELLAARLEQGAAARAATDVVIAIGIVLALAGGVLAMLVFTSTVSRRVQVLEENARRFARGDPMIPLLPGNDEVGRLGHSLAQAALVLAARQRALEAEAAELERRVHERTADLERANAALAAEIERRAHTQEQLADAKRRVEAVIESSPLAIISLDIDGLVTSWNRAAEEMFGWKAEEVIGKPLPTVPEEESDDFKRMIARLGRGERIVARNVRRRRKDGTILDARLWVAPLYGPDGAIRGNIGVLTDITSQRRMEQQFFQSQKMEAIGRLAGGVAHDFNNVITVIAGYGQMLLEGAKDDPMLREAAEEVLNSADRAAGLARQLLAFSRRQAIQPRVFNLNELVLNLQKLLGRVIGEDIELKTTLRPDTAPVLADPGQMEQVLMNLAVNARDAMPEGGKLMIETRNVTLDESYTAAHAGVKPGAYVLLSVSDTGMGMTEDVKAHLFEPFFTTKERGRGTGLGLSTVYGIVKQHGGDIWVYSEPGHGTTFKIYLPRAAEGAVEAEAAPEQAAPARPGTETILVAEDEEAVRKLLRDVLEQRGYSVLEAPSGQDALAIAESGRHIDLLLTDVVMPRMGGRELARRFALLFPDTPILFLSGYTDEMVGEREMLGSGADFMSKPFSPEDLARRVRDLLDRPKAGDADGGAPPSPPAGTVQ